MARTPSSIPTKILLPVDFSPSSNAALDMATNLAQHFHAELCLLNVIPMFPINGEAEYFPQTTFDHDAMKSAEEQLTIRVAALTKEGLKASFSVEIGNDVVGNIMMVIERDDIDMVVLSTHGLSGWRPIVFGSIAEKVVKLVQCPLLLLRSAPPVEAHELPSKLAGELVETAP